MADALARRDALVALLQADLSAQFPSLVLVFDNQPFDWGSPPETFLHLEVEDGEDAQASLALVNPRTRVHGAVQATYYCREGLGTRGCLATLGWLAGHLRYRYAAGVQFQNTRLAPSGDPVDGWYRRDLTLSYYADM